ncbi:hypothetical protein [Mesorhizobium sp. IMUNJ 23232]|uniref:hypothetical protein n=1 Tax=Mesorhizobium sp. IMUNJ 23232 TaxID=3376064 RepID=UPI0037ADEB64
MSADSRSDLEEIVREYLTAPTVVELREDWKSASETWRRLNSKAAELLREIVEAGLNLPEVSFKEIGRDHSILIGELDHLMRWTEDWANLADQFTPPGSPGSIHFGKGITSAAPSSTQRPVLVVSDIETARAELVGRGADVSEVFHRSGPGQPAVSGRDPEGRSYVSFAAFSDPDGNSWLLQEITARFPGRVDPNTTSFVPVPDLAAALRRAAAAHGEHKKHDGGRHDVNWPDWYAEYMVAEHTGRELPL